MSVWPCAMHVRMLVVALLQRLESLDAFMFVEQKKVQKQGKKIDWTKQPNDMRWFKRFRIKAGDRFR